MEVEYEMRKSVNAYKRITAKEELRMEDVDM